MFCRLCITFLAFDVFFVVICVAVACIIGIAVCCCLPCIIAILYAVADQVIYYDLFFSLQLMAMEDLGGVWPNFSIKQGLLTNRLSRKSFNERALKMK